MAVDDDGKKRYSLRIPREDAIWLDREIERVAEVEGLTQCSLTMILHRIVKGNLDLTHQGISVCAQAQYRIRQQNGRRQKKKPKPVARPAAA